MKGKMIKYGRPIFVIAIMVITIIILLCLMGERISHPLELSYGMIGSPIGSLVEVMRYAIYLIGLIFIFVLGLNIMEHK